MKRLRIVIEADHEESQDQPIRDAVGDFMPRLRQMGYQGAEAEIQFDVI